MTIPDATPLYTPPQNGRISPWNLAALRIPGPAAYARRN